MNWGEGVHLEGRDIWPAVLIIDYDMFQGGIKSGSIHTSAIDNSDRWYMK